MKAFQAHGTGGNRVTRPNPRAAPQAFFEEFPRKLKCDIVEGAVDGPCFTVMYGRASAGEWPKSWKDVTKKMVADLPDSI